MKKEKYPLPRLDVFCTNDELRPVMNCIYIDEDYAIGSDAHVLIKMNVSEYFKDIVKANKKMIHSTAWFQMLWANERTCTETGIHCKFNNFECTFNYSNDGEYPDYKRLLNGAYKAVKESNGIKDFSLMPFLMARFLKLGSHNPVKFYLISEDRNIFIQSDKYHGILMPCRNQLEFNDLKYLYE